MGVGVGLGGGGEWCGGGSTELMTKQAVAIPADALAVFKWGFSRKENFTM